MPHTNKTNNIYHFQIYGGQVKISIFHSGKNILIKMSGICKDLVKIFVQSNLKMNMYDLLPVNISICFKTNHQWTLAYISKQITPEPWLLCMPLKWPSINHYGFCQNVISSSVVLKYKHSQACWEKEGHCKVLDDRSH